MQIGTFLENVRKLLDPSQKLKGSILNQLSLHSCICVILLTHQSNNQPKDMGENMTLFAEVIIHLHELNVTV